MVHMRRVLQVLVLPRHSRRERGVQNDTHLQAPSTSTVFTSLLIYTSTPLLIYTSTTHFKIL
jgi:hypothetical protein